MHLRKEERSEADIRGAQVSQQGEEDGIAATVLQTHLVAGHPCASPSSALKDALLRQCDRNEELGRELRTRNVERWQLLQLLSQRDERLQHEELVAGRQRTALSSVRSAVRYYLAVCVFHGWCAYLRQARMRKALMRTKCQEAAAKMRHACGMMQLILKCAVGRSMTGALHVLRLHGSSNTLVDAPSGRASEALNVVGQPQRLEEATAPETPRRQRFLTDTKAQTDWEPGPSILDMRYGSPGPPSEVSTSAPSSLSQSAATTRLSLESTGRRPLAHASFCRHLPLVLNAAVTRRLFWSMTRWSRLSRLSEHEGARQMSESTGPPSQGRKLDTLQSKIAELESRVAEVFPEPCAQPAEEASSFVVAMATGVSAMEEADHLAQAERRAADERHEAAALQICVHEATSHVVVLRSHLEEAHAREEAQLQERATAEERLSRQWCAEQAALLQEQRVCSELQAAVSSLREAQLRAEQQEALDRAHRSTDHYRLEVSEQACAKAKARLARQLSWREAAHQRIGEMVQCGEELEQERTELRQELARAQQRHRSQQRKIEALTSSSTEEAQLCELLKARVISFEQDHQELFAGIEEHREGHRESIAMHRNELTSLRHECARLEAELCESHATNEAAVKTATQAARNDLQAAWERERGIWAQSADDLEHRAAGFRRELETAEQSERAEAIAVVEARAQEVRAWRDEALLDGQRAKKAAWAAVKTELAVCADMKEQLQQRLEETSELQQASEEYLQERRRGPLANLSCALLTGSRLEPYPRSSSTEASGHAMESGPPTPQLNELDAYAKLVERLQQEVEDERALRESSEKSLAIIRSSYQLLLQRVTVYGESGERSCMGPSGGQMRAADGPGSHAALQGTQFAT